jgi:hypothetical protein
MNGEQYLEYDSTKRLSMGDKKRVNFWGPVDTNDEKRFGERQLISAAAKHDTRRSK